MSTPCVMRASYIQANVMALEVLGPHVEAAVRHACATELRAIERAAPSAWLPIEFNMALLERIRLATNDVDVRFHASHAFARAIQGPLQQLVQAATRLLRINPPRVWRFAPHAWGLMFKGAGTVVYDARRATSGVFVLTGAPAVIRDSPSFLLALAGAIEGSAGLGRARAVVQCPAAADVARGGDVSFAVEWDPWEGGREKKGVGDSDSFG